MLTAQLSTLEALLLTQSRFSYATCRRGIQGNAQWVEQEMR